MQTVILHFQLLFVKYKDQSPFLHFPPLLKPQLPSSAVKASATCISIRLPHPGWQVVISLDQDEMHPLHVWVPLSLSLHGHMAVQDTQRVIFRSIFCFYFLNERILCGRVLSSSQLLLVLDCSENLMKAWGQGRGVEWGE